MAKPPKIGGNTAYRAASQEKYDTLEAEGGQAGELALKPMEFPLDGLFEESEPDFEKGTADGSIF